MNKTTLGVIIGDGGYIMESTLRNREFDNLFAELYPELSGYES